MRWGVAVHAAVMLTSLRCRRRHYCRAGIITTPLPLGAVAVLGLGVSMLTKTLSFAEAFSAFATEIP